MLATALCLVWGSAFVIQKVGLAHSEPTWYATGRVAVAAAALAVATVALKPSRTAIRNLGAGEHLLAAALGATNIVGFMALQMAGMDTVGAGSAAAIIYVQPLLTLLGARVVFGEQLTSRKLVGGLAGFAGVAVVGLRQLSGGSGEAVILLLAGAACWACGTLLLKAASDGPVLPLIALQHLYGVGPLLALALALEPRPVVDATVIVTLVVLGVVASAGGWLIWMVLLARGEAGVVATYVFSVPLIGAASGILLLGEPFNASIGFGAVLVGLGARLVSSPDARVAPP